MTVERWNTDRPTVGVGAVVFDDDGRLLLIERKRDPGKGKWAVPGGKPNLGEPLEAAVVREAKEETGLDVEVGGVLWVGEIIEEGFHLVIIDYAATVIGGTLEAGDDAGDARWVTIEEARQLPLSPTMIQMLDTLGL